MYKSLLGSVCRNSVFQEHSGEQINLLLDFKIFLTKPKDTMMAVTCFKQCLYVTP